MIRILVVDDDQTSLMVAKASLQRWNNEVIAVSHALQALSLLWERDERPYDLVLADVHMPDMDGFKLMHEVYTNFNIPVVLISADDRTNVMCKGFGMGALAYLVKPLTAADASSMWQHTATWRNREKNAWKEFNEANYIPRINITSSSSISPYNEHNPIKRRSDRAVWNSNLHNRFVEAMLILGPKSAIARNIIEVMNVPWLTREQVASHMQKFKKFLDKILNGETNLDQTIHQWIDSNYYSTIVRGNPNKILIDQLLEERRTGKSADPIKASQLRLPQYNEAESSSSHNITMLMPNNHASSAVNVPRLTPGFGGITFDSSGYLNLGNQMGYHQNNLISADQALAFNAGSLSSNQNLLGENNFNANLQVGNVQLHHPNTDVNEFENPLGMNLQLENTVPEQSLLMENSGGETNDSPLSMNEQAPQLGGGVQLLDGADHIPEASENSLLGSVSSLDEGDLSDLALILEMIGDDPEVGNEGEGEGNINPGGE